ncbi:hypothetical protein KC355_g12417, partial [Hortaea werneckii]
QEDAAVLTSLTALLNGPSKPDFLDEIRVTEISLGDEFPIFSNCRVIPVDEHGTPIKALSGNRGERLQARMDVDLSDVVTLGIETKLVLNYPKPFVAVLPVALAVSVVRFSGTLSLSFSPSSQPNPYPSANDSEARTPGPARNEGHPLNPTGSSPTTLTFTFLDDYRLDLSVHSLIGSRSRLQDVPKIAQLVEARIHQWFDDRCVEPRFQQIVLPSLWPRKKNTRGGRGGGDAGDGGGPEDGEDEADQDEAPSPTERAMSSVAAAAAAAAVGGNGGSSSKGAAGSGGGLGGRKATAEVGKAKGFDDQVPAQSKQQPSAEEISSRTPAETKTSEQRTRKWAARHATPTTTTTTPSSSGSKTTAGGSSGGATRRQQQQQQQLLNETAIAEEGEEEMMSELELAGEEMREADLRKKRLRRKRAERVLAEQQMEQRQRQQQQQQQQGDREQEGFHPRRYQRAGSLDGDLDDDDDVEGDEGSPHQQQQQRGEGDGKASAHENGGVVDYETGDFLGTGMRLRSGTGRSNSYIFEEGLVRGGGGGCGKRGGGGS